MCCDVDHGVVVQVSTRYARSIQASRNSQQDYGNQSRSSHAPVTPAPCIPADTAGDSPWRCLSSIPLSARGHRPSTPRPAGPRDPRLHAVVRVHPPWPWRYYRVAPAAPGNPRQGPSGRRCSGWCRAYLDHRRVGWQRGRLVPVPADPSLMALRRQARPRQSGIHRTVTATPECSSSCARPAIHHGLAKMALSSMCTRWRWRHIPPTGGRQPPAASPPLLPTATTSAGL